MADVASAPAIVNIPLPTVEPVPAPQHSESESKVPAAITPPASDESIKTPGSEISDLTDIDLGDDEDDETEIEPDHYYEGGRIPVFKPTMDQFRSFKKFIDKIDKYGMKSGIVKVIPPQEWRDSLPALDDAVKTIKVKNPITQEFSGTHGTYTQANIEKQRSYNLPQWKALTEESQHQPPARRGEKRKNQEKAPRPSSSRTSRAASTSRTATDGEKRRPGRPRKTPLPKVEIPPPQDEESIEAKGPPTPTSPSMTPATLEKTPEVSSSREPSVHIKKEEPMERKKPSAPKPKGRQPKTVAERRKYNRAETADQIDEAAFADFDYRFYHADDEFTPERCVELEALYWRTLTFAAPMYGADMPGSLFDDSTTSWNVAKLENILDVLGQKVPGVNTAYLYLGMWKATFAWHLEDVDLYSINYIHFGAPKQWYSISQEDARRFENAMKNVWPNDAKNCSQFLRHKTYLISPSLLQSQYNIKVNKLVHYEGEFVITFPYGYHSGYNLGYNCAESVNFATEQWLDFGRIAKKCDCEADSVWIDVEQIERRLRGEPTPEYYEETDDDDDMDGNEHLPSPPSSVIGKSKGKKRKRADAASAQGKKKVKKIKIRIRNHSAEPCVLCPNDLPAEELLPTDTGRRAHRICAFYTPETYISDDEGEEKVYNVALIDKARLDLKCSFCRSKKGACFQCSSRKCTRAYHATCAAPAGVQVELGPTAVYGADGTEYASEGYDFRCRFHRPKRPKTATAESLEANTLVRKFARSLKEKDVVQAQYLYGDVFAGTVVENRHSERALVLDILPEGDRIEVEWRWVVALDPADSQLPKPSPDAKPLPEHMSKQIPPDRNAEFGPPQEGDFFNDPTAIQKWAEFNTAPAPHNPHQTDVDFNSINRLWYYLGKTSTEARAQFTEDLSNPRHNPASLPKEPTTSKYAVTPQSATYKRQIPDSSMIGPNFRALNAAVQFSKQHHLTQQHSQQSVIQKPYQYKPRISVDSKQSIDTGSMRLNPHSPSNSQQLLMGSIRPSNVKDGSIQQQPYMQGHRDVTSPAGYQQSRQFPPNPYATLHRQNQNNAITNHQQTHNGVHSPDEMRNSQQMPQQNVEAGSPITSKQEAPLSALSASSLNPGSNAKPMSQTGSLMQEHAQRIAKYPYLRQSFCRRDAQYISPYTPSGGFTEPYATFLPQSRTDGQTILNGAPFYVERTVPTGPAYYNSNNSESKRAPFHQEFRTPSPNQQHQGYASSGSSDLRRQALHQTPQQFEQHVRRELTHSDTARAADVLERMSAQT